MIKKLLHSIQAWALLALTATGTVACTDEGLVDGAAEVRFATVLPANAHSRAFGDATQVDSLVVGVFDEEQKELSRQLFPVASGSADVRLSLAKGQTYGFVFWAYCSKQEGYDTSDLSAIKMNALPEPVSFGQAEAMDAFFAVEQKVTVTGNCSYKVELVRPLAQINVGSTGAALQASFTTKGVAEVFHPFENSVSGSADFTWNFGETTTETFEVDGEKYNYLAMGYVFAPNEATKIAAELTVTGEGGAQTWKFPQVEVEANNRCNIAGNFTE